MNKNIWVKIGGRWYQSMQTIFKISQSYDEEDASLFFADRDEVEEISLNYQDNSTPPATEESRVVSKMESTELAKEGSRE